MKILECDAKNLLQKQGIPIPRGEVVTSAEEAAIVAQAIGQPVLLKAQIPSGGRMKAGGIHFADIPTEAQTIAAQLLGRELKGFTVTHLLIEAKLESAAELFLGATYDSRTRQAVLLASKSGGINVEQSGDVLRVPFSVQNPFLDYNGRETAARLGFSGPSLAQLGGIIAQIANLFLEWDATLLEINPLILSADGCWWVADVHLELDDDAAYRQTNLLEKLPLSLEWANRRSDFEQQAAQIDQADHRGVAGRLVPFDGNLGLIIGGGGASLTIFDAVLDAGLKPANYCEVGGNPSVWKTKELTKLILSQPQVERIAVIMNVVSNTRVDLVARGVIKGVLELGLDPQQVIAAFRVPGSWEDEGQAILTHYGIPFFGRETSIDQVVEAIK